MQRYKLPTMSMLQNKNEEIVELASRDESRRWSISEWDTSSILWDIVEQSKCVFDIDNGLKTSQPVSFFPDKSGTD